MAVPALSVAKTICEMRGWQVSNLAIQKILYVAQMFHLVLYGKPLINEGFQAWEYGPVIPEVYARIKGFGSRSVPNVFHWVSDIPANSPEYDTIRQAVEVTRQFTPGQLVDFTHWKDGAWAKRYEAGKRGISIPNDLILAEYHDRRRST